MDSAMITSSGGGWARLAVKFCKIFTIDGSQNTRLPDYNIQSWRLSSNWRASGGHGAIRESFRSGRDQAEQGGDWPTRKWQLTNTRFMLGVATGRAPEELNWIGEAADFGLPSVSVYSRKSGRESG